MGVSVTVEFVVLGEVAARHDGRTLRLGHARQRSVLAVLLLQAGRTVSADQLIDRVWAEQPPRRAHSTLYGYLSRLRQALTATGVTVAREHGGYQLTAHPATVDAHRFAQLVGQARDTTPGPARLALLDQALALWQGDALAGLDTPWLTAQRDVLERDRHAAELDRTDLALGLGRHDELLTPLAVRAAAHPLDERVAGQLMIALYRAGRPADALTHYQATRLRLADELGTDPGAPLRRLHQQILTDDPCLAAPEPPPSTGHGGPHPVPRQLPMPPRLFTARTEELGQLDAAAEAAPHAPVIAAITGAGGVGKSWLALHWAHGAADRFPDGQLYVDLRGFDPTQPPVDATAALRGFLDALGVPAAAIPADPHAQAALFRSTVAGRRLLIVLDDARDNAHVLPLLPGSATCAVLVTSRNRLTGLATAHGARLLDLNLLTDIEARRLLGAHLGRERTAAEPVAVAALLRWCAGLPLALGIVAARAAARPDFALSATPPPAWTPWTPPT
ncbi:BTAD domain-containing putative transcriptional regulator [Catellatospora sp. NPDC049111]|uniref:AfsR/SARP family transcriptional regulator n=1 Tax=Catellatospora sp. NPDC049111 TaxID=3155271 RepID=UPI0033D7A938